MAEDASRSSLPKICALREKAFALGESDLATLLRIRAAAFDAEAFLMSVSALTARGDLAFESSIGSIAVNRYPSSAISRSCALTAYGHGGSEDHGASNRSHRRYPARPEALPASEAFEVVAVLEGKKLLLYVDRFASNEPVAKAKVEVDGGGLKGVASEIRAGHLRHGSCRTWPKPNMR
jgi:hypothetical protein